MTWIRRLHFVNIHQMTTPPPRSSIIRNYSFSNEKRPTAVWPSAIKSWHGFIKLFMVMILCSRWSKNDWKTILFNDGFCNCWATATAKTVFQLSAEKSYLKVNVQQPASFCLFSSFHTNITNLYVHPVYGAKILTQVT